MALPHPDTADSPADSPAASPTVTAEADALWQLRGTHRSAYEGQQAALIEVTRTGRMPAGVRYAGWSVEDVHCLLAELNAREGENRVPEVPVRGVRDQIVRLLRAATR